MTNLKKYKALVTDFDGTLVGANFTPSSKVKKGIIALVKKGISFSIATGRPYQGIIKSICKDLNLQAPQIVSGGSRIIDPRTDSVLWVEYVPQDTTKKIVKLFLENNYFFSVECGDYIYTPNAHDVNNYTDLIFKDLKELNYNAVNKIVLEITTLKEQEKVEESLKNLYPDLFIVKSGGIRMVLDITSMKTSKHVATLELSKIINIDPSLMIGVGDNYNDYPLLTACGFKVAMEKAPKELKDIADMIVPNVEDDGLLKVINLLIKKP